VAPLLGVARVPVISHRLVEGVQGPIVVLDSVKDFFLTEKVEEGEGVPVVALFDQGKEKV
jgi:hypothetical protein